MVTRAGQDGGGVAVARKVVRVEACHLKKQMPSCGPVQAPGREVIMGKEEEEEEPAPLPSRLKTRAKR